MAENKKIRHFPHVDGQWVSHVSIGINIDYDHLEVPDGFQKLWIEKDLHISISPLFSLSKHQVPIFLQRCENISSSLRKECIHLYNGVYLFDHSRTSTFYCLEIQENSLIQDIYQRIHRIINVFKPKILEEFSEPIHHVSIARSPILIHDPPPQHKVIVCVMISLNISIGGKITSYVLKR